MALKELLGDNVVGKDGAVVDVDSLGLGDKDLIGLYFSAHWCPPCRAFTPALAKCYGKIKERGKKFEVVFVSSDQDEAAFKDYYDTMPWLALKFGTDKKEELGDKYEISGIPALVLLNKNGEEVTRNGRSVVANDLEGGNYPWTPKKQEQEQGAYFKKTP